MRLLAKKNSEVAYFKAELDHLLQELQLQQMRNMIKRQTLNLNN